MSPSHHQAINIHEGVLHPSLIMYSLKSFIIFLSIAKGYISVQPLHACNVYQKDERPTQPRSDCAKHRSANKSNRNPIRWQMNLFSSGNKRQQNNILPALKRRTFPVYSWMTSTDHHTLLIVKPAISLFAFLQKRLQRPAKECQLSTSSGPCYPDTISRLLIHH